MQASICESEHLVGVVLCQFCFPVWRSRAGIGRPDCGAADICSHLRGNSQHDDVGADVQSPNHLPATPERRESVSPRLPAERCNVLLHLSATELVTDVHKIHWTTVRQCSITATCTESIQGVQTFTKADHTGSPQFLSPHMYGYVE